MLPGLVLLLAACSGGATTTPAIIDVWARATAGTDQPGAAYLVITNPGSNPDALIGASSPAAASVEMNETSIDASGMMGMHPVTRIEVPAGGTMSLEPDGFHLMLMGLDDPLRVGDTVTLELVFERAGTIAVQAPVREG